MARERDRVTLLQVIADKAHPQTSDHATASLGVMAKQSQDSKFCISNIKFNLKAKPFFILSQGVVISKRVVF